MIFWMDESCKYYVVTMIHAAMGDIVMSFEHNKSPFYIDYSIYIDTILTFVVYENDDTSYKNYFNVPIITTRSYLLDILAI